jgi:hypothetical protein
MVTFVNVTIRRAEVQVTCAIYAELESHVAGEP